MYQYKACGQPLYQYWACLRVRAGNLCVTGQCGAGSFSLDEEFLVLPLIYAKLVNAPSF